MSTTRAYTTTVITEDGAFAAEVLAFPDYFDDARPVEPLALLAQDIEVDVGA